MATPIWLPRLNFTNPIDTISLGLGLLLGTAGLPHILMRFFTVPDAKAARTSVVLGGRPDRFLLRDDHVPRLRRPGSAGRVRDDGLGGRGRQPGRAASRPDVGGGAGSISGDAFLAIIAAVAFATILAVVAGLLISASGAVAHDVWSDVSPQAACI